MRPPYFPPRLTEEYGWVGLVVALAVGSVLRARAFESVALGWDPCEYVWAVEGPHLPHSPYVLYLWLGLLVSRAAPAEVALSALSLVGSLAATAAVWWAVRWQVGGTVAPAVAAMALAVAPIAVDFGGTQEVYAVQSALVVWALATARSPALSGFLFGAAFAAHNGTAFAVAGWLVCLALVEQPARIRRIATACIAAAALPVAAVVFVVGVFVVPGAHPLVATTLGYFRGTAPPLSAASADQFLHEMLAYSRRALEFSVGFDLGSIAIVAVACLTLACLRPRWLAPWFLLAAPYAIYESSLARVLDTGIYATFVAPPLAAALGLAVGALHERLQPRAARVLVTAMALGALVAPARASLRLGEDLPSRRDFLASALARHAAWIRANTPADAIVLQPAGTTNSNLLPSRTARRPIVRENGELRLFAGGRWTPLNQYWYTPVTPAIVANLLASGTPLLALEPEPSLPVRWDPLPGAAVDGRPFVYRAASIR